LRKDKPADCYIEHVVSEESEILKDVDQPLRAHREHGSDRPELKAERLKAKGKSDARLLKNKSAPVLSSGACSFNPGDPRKPVPAKFFDSPKS
jgi:hypothetical protein